MRHLESKKIQTRMFFAGNILRHPCFDGIRDTGEGFRVSGTLENTDAIMERSFWVGVYPGMNDEMLETMSREISGFVEENRTRFTS